MLQIARHNCRICSLSTWKGCKIAPPCIYVYLHLSIFNFLLYPDVYIYIYEFVFIHLTFPYVILSDLTVHVLSNLLLTYLSMHAPILSCQPIISIYVIYAYCLATLDGHVIANMYPIYGWSFAMLEPPSHRNPSHGGRGSSETMTIVRGGGKNYYACNYL